VFEVKPFRVGQNPINARKGITTVNDQDFEAGDWLLLSQNPINARKGITTFSATVDPAEKQYVRILLMPVRALRRSMLTELRAHPIESESY